MDLVESIAHLGLDGSVPGPRDAVERSVQTTKRMRTALSDFDAAGGMDVVVFGSLARQEYTTASDVDYLVLVNAVPSNPAAPRALLQRVKDFLADEAAADGSKKAPGTSGIFGRSTGVFDIINQVGLEGDTNSTHTVRMEIIHLGIGRCTSMSRRPTPPSQGTCVNGGASSSTPTCATPRVNERCGHPRRPW